MQFHAGPKHTVAYVIAISFLIVGGHVFADSPESDSSTTAVSGPYLGQDPPGRTPQVFASGFISTERDEHSAVAMSPDGAQVFYTDVSLKKYAVVLYTESVEGVWSEPEIAPFSGTYWDDGVSFSPDGTRLYLASRRPLAEGQPVRKDSDVWYLDRTDAGWGEPQLMDGPINSDADDGGLSFTPEGILYFSSYRPGGPGDCNIYRCEPTNGEYTAPRILDDSINVGISNFAPCIAPDESYLIFGCMKDEETGIDLYVSFRTTEGAWSQARPLGPDFNEGFISWFPGLSPDGQFLFYCALNPEGNLDIYWVSTEAIDDVRMQIMPAVEP